MTMNDIYVNAKDIHTLAAAFTQAKTDVDAAKAALDNVAVEPGDFTEADTLKATVTARKESLAKNLTGMSAAFDHISQKLVEAAGKYTDTDAQNKMTAADISGLIDAVNGDLPGFSSSN